MRCWLGYVLILTLMPVPASAQGALALGGGLYASRMSYSRFDRATDFTGLVVTGTYTFSDNFAVRGGYFHTDHDKFQDWEASGLDTAVLLGLNLRGDGPRAYLGVGYFTEAWRGEGWREDFAGPQAVLGGGWGWSRVALDLWVTVRGADDYADLIGRMGNSGGRVASRAGAIVGSYRF